MKPITKATVWILGLLISIHGLSAGLSWWYFGYLHPGALATMVVLLTPLALAAVGIIAVSEWGWAARAPRTACLGRGALGVRSGLERVEFSNGTAGSHEEVARR